MRTIQGNSGFDELQAMRDNSPTGGALGQVSNTEIGLLQAIKGDIQRSQSPEQMTRNLRRYKEQYAKSRERIQQAYDEALQSGALTQQPSQGFPSSPLSQGGQQLRKRLD